jgi:hypothetical protein
VPAKQPGGVSNKPTPSGIQDRGDHDATVTK